MKEKMGLLEINKKFKKATPRFGSGSSSAVLEKVL
jgi:hypothetical protein